MTKDNGGPAFPSIDVTGGHPQTLAFTGMSMRDWFATHAMQADLNYQGLEGRDDVRHIAAMAYQMADAMLEARKK